MAETTRDRVAFWGDTWARTFIDRSRDLAERAKKMFERSDRLKDIVRRACNESGIEYAFFGLGEGVHCYTAAPVTATVVDEGKLKAENPELYEKCLKTVTAFSLDAFLTLADEETKAKYASEVVKKKGAERFDSAKSVLISDIVSNGKPLKYEGDGQQPVLINPKVPLFDLSVTGPLTDDEVELMRELLDRDLIDTLVLKDFEYFVGKEKYDEARVIWASCVVSLGISPYLFPQGVVDRAREILKLSEPAPEE